VERGEHLAFPTPTAVQTTFVNFIEALELAAPEAAQRAVLALHRVIDEL
jgi:hypothetical protein